MTPEPFEFEEKRQPVFNVPFIILALLAVMALMHGYRVWMLHGYAELDFVFAFAFVPIRFGFTDLADAGDFTKWWTPLTYSLLHADLAHIVVNSIWLLAFGTVVARRFGPVSFLIFCVVTSVAGAVAHFISAPLSTVPMVGASAVVSGCMGASLRFAFPSGGRFNPMEHDLPAQSLLESLRNSQAMTFLAIWMAINLVFGLGGELFAGEGQSIAWQAHVGGFAAGFLGFALFDRNVS